MSQPACTPGACSGPSLLFTPVTQGLRPVTVTGTTLAFGRDHGGSTTRTGVTSLQISRVQVRVRRVLAGKWELSNRGVGLVRLVRPSLVSSGGPPPALMKQNASVILNEGDRVQFLHVLRSCKCPLKGPCSCPAGDGDRVAALAEWRTVLGTEVATSAPAEASSAPAEATPMAAPVPSSHAPAVAVQSPASPVATAAAPAAMAADAAATAAAPAATTAAPAVMATAPAAMATAPAATTAAPAAMAADAAAVAAAPAAMAVDAAATASEAPPPARVPPLDMLRASLAEAVGALAGLERAAPASDQLRQLAVLIRRAADAASELAARQRALPSGGDVPSGEVACGDGALGATQLSGGSALSGQEPACDVPRAGGAPSAGLPRGSGGARGGDASVASACAALPPAAEPVRAVQGHGETGDSRAGTRVEPPPVLVPAPARGAGRRGGLHSGWAWGRWDSTDLLEADRCGASEFLSDDGWVQCDRCHKWRPPPHGSPSSAKGGGGGCSGGGGGGDDGGGEGDHRRSDMDTAEEIVDDGEPWCVPCRVPRRVPCRVPCRAADAHPPVCLRQCASASAPSPMRLGRTIHHALHHTPCASDPAAWASPVDRDARMWAWRGRYCEMHPDVRLASCAAPARVCPIGECYQVAHLPEYNPQRGDEHDDERTREHSRLAPLTVSSSELPDAGTRQSRRRASGKRSKRVGAGLPDGDSQRPEAVAEEAYSGGNGRAGGHYREDSSDYGDSSSEQDGGGAEEGAGDDSDFQFQRRSTARRSTGSWSPVKRGRASSSAPRHTPQR